MARNTTLGLVNESDPQLQKIVDNIRKGNANNTELSDFQTILQKFRDFGIISALIPPRFEIRDAEGKLIATVEGLPPNQRTINLLLRNIHEIQKFEKNQLEERSKK